MPGLDGLQGRPGDQGKPGVQGEPGVKGERGRDGRDGRGRGGHDRGMRGLPGNFIFGSNSIFYHARWPRIITVRFSTD